MLKCLERFYMSVRFCQCFIWYMFWYGKDKFQKKEVSLSLIVLGKDQVGYYARRNKLIVEAVVQHIIIKEMR